MQGTITKELLHGFVSSEDDEDSAGR